MLNLCISLLFALPPLGSATAVQPTAREQAATTRTPTLARLMRRFGTPVQLSRAEQDRLDNVSTVMSTGRVERAVESWSRFDDLYREAHPKASPQTLEALLAAAARKAFFERNPQLAALAHEAAFYNRQREALEGEARAMRKALSGRTRTDRVTFTPLRLSKYSREARPTERGTPSTRTVEAWETHLTDLEAQLAELDNEQQRLGSSQIQNLMSRYNQNEKLVAAVYKKKSESDELSLIDKI